MEGPRRGRSAPTRTQAAPSPKRPLAVAFERQGQMPPRDLHGAVQLLEPRGVEMLLRPGVAEGGDERLLIDVMLGQHRRRAEYVGIHQRATSTGSATRTSSWPSSR